ncbi:unnamed protein product [Hydatigera taeniaeformis]|uniref:Myosin_tail_1 domain-containing protein n=1 Tax=Hydatigena taeniaeformis TaxID=6205 RepID=A0A0R3WZX4_HYDTA|nr:unnamed protein product [Hydatigera taeniaeformis]
MQSGFHRKELGFKEIHENPTVEKLKESVKVAWGNVALWKHRYTKECRRREALEKKLKTLASMDESSAHVDECLHLKKVAFAALETCSIKDEEISALRRKMCLLMRDINELTGLVTAHTRKRANAKIVRLLKYQLDLELEKSTLQLQNDRLSTEVMKLRSMFDECTKGKASMCVSGDVSHQLTHCNNTALIQLRHRAEVERAESEVEKIKQELTVTNMKLESCQEKLVQLRDHNQRQEAQLTAQTTELESCRQREQELRRSFAQKLQSLEMVLTTSQCAFASRERELLKRIATSGDKQD